jgi:phosphoribosylformimino-5-aminoimidazole carboxamide ribonucleotide (ProFAR) isomerase
VSDLNGVRHSTEVTASTLYEAVALGLAAIREHDWVGEIAEGLNTVEVSVTLVAVTDSVRVMEFNRWLNQKGGSPIETANRNNIRRILGLHDDGKR